MIKGLRTPMALPLWNNSEAWAGYPALRKVMGGMD